MNPGTEITKNGDASRYELSIDGHLVGYATFEVSGNTVAIPHTFVDPAHRGGQLAQRLVEYALEDIRAQGRSVLPVCPYVARLIERNPEAYLDLVPTGDRPDFGLR